MAYKEMTMVLEVDLECERCNKKIRRVLHKIKDKMNINTISFDEKRNLVTISGPFDAEKVRRNVCCEAGRIIKGMNIKAPEVKKTEEKDDAGMETEEDERKAPAPTVDLRPLLKKMLERPKARSQSAPCNCCCGCSCGKQTTQPAAAQGVVAAASVWPAPTSSVYGHVYEAPSLCYGVPVYNIKGC